MGSLLREFDSTEHRVCDMVRSIFATQGGGRPKENNEDRVASHLLDFAK